jgi:hypothetical protein
MDQLLTYRDFVKSRMKNNPCLAGLDSFLGTTHTPLATSRTIGYIDYYRSNAEAKAFRSVPTADIASIPSDIRGRVILAEDIDARTIELFGAALDLDPVFFASHVTTDFHDLENAPPPPSLALFPSQLASRDYLHIQYQQILALNSEEATKDFPYKLKTRSNIPRNVRRLPGLEGRQIALGRACCSLVVKNYKDSWICKIWSLVSNRALRRAIFADLVCKA